MKRTAIYMRVSSDRQAQEGDSIPAQRDALRKYIDNRDNLILAGEYLDDGISGTKAMRDELSRLLDDVRAGKIDLIIFTKLDRWFRSVRHYTATQELLDKHNVGWLAIWEPIYDTTTPQGRLIVNQMMSIAQFEAEQTGQRIRQVQAYKLTQHEVISGSTPPGYSIKDKHLEPNQDAPNVVEAFETYARTGSLNDTMRIITGLPGIPSSRNSIKKMLRNPIYIGVHQASGLKGFCRPIIPNDLFYDVQRKLSINIKCSQREIYVFSGLIRCAECGRVFGANTRRRKRGSGAMEVIHQYRCPKHYNEKPAQCQNAKVISETALEKYLVNNISGLMSNAVITYEAGSAHTRDYTAQLSSLQKKLSRLKDLYINELITIEEYKSDKEAFEEQIETLRSKMGRGPEADAGAVEELKALSQMDFSGIYADLSLEERRRFWRGIIRRITFSADREYKIEFLALASGSK